MRNYCLSGMILIALMSLGVTALNSSAPVNAQSKSAKSDPMHAGDMSAHMKKMNEMMIHHLGERDAEYEMRFIDMMIPHHEGAILMAEHALKHSEKPELKRMAEKMIEAQQKEIDQLRKWRKEWYSAKEG
jgi:uncharacterized protein (DUF305 family)